MNDDSLLGTDNAPRRCSECGPGATAYLHDVGFHCGDCHPDAPPAPADNGGSL